MGRLPARPAASIGQMTGGQKSGGVRSNRLLSLSTNLDVRAPDIQTDKLANGRMAARRAQSSTASRRGQVA